MIFGDEVKDKIIETILIPVNFIKNLYTTLLEIYNSIKILLYTSTCLPFKFYLVLREFIIDFKNIFVVEEHTKNGGIGSIISEIKSDFDLKFRLKRFGIKDKNLYTYDSRDKIYQNNQIDKNSIKKLISKL